MFENNPSSAPMPPSNLPTEPDDMFSAVEPAPAAAGAPSQVEGPPAAPPNALEAGMLRPKAAPVTTMPIIPEPDGASAPPPGVSAVTRGPMMGRILLVLAAIVVIVGGGLGALIFYRRSTASGLLSKANITPPVGTPTAPPMPVQPLSEPTPELTESAPVPVAPPPTAPRPAADESASVTRSPVSPTTTDAASKTINDQILFGEQIDSDKDGVSDSDEITLFRTDPRNSDTDGDGLTDGEEILVWRTNALKPDTDGDGLSDGDEVKLWKTDPLNPDTDGDGFVDGKEVANGYNPKGPGKIERLPDGMSTSTYQAKYQKK